MARAKKDKPADGAGHNSGSQLPDPDRAALSAHHQLKVREARRAAEKAKDVYDEAREVVNGQFALAKGDLGYDRKTFEHLLLLGDMRESEFQAYERKRTGMLIEGGLKPPGTQLELALGDTVDDMAEAHRDGYRAGKGGDIGEIPDHVHPACTQEWMTGWGEGQAENIALLARAETILAERAKPAVSLDEGDEDDDADGDIDPDTVAKKARDLKKQGWMEPTAEESSLEQAAA